MRQSIGQTLQATQASTDSIGFQKKQLTEDDLTLLDDVPQLDINEFREIIHLPIENWAFNNSTRMQVFPRTMFAEINQYFAYLESLGT